MHLWIPFVASIAFVCGLICVNRLGRDPSLEVGPTSVLFFSNIGLAIGMSGFWLLGGTPRVDLFWQPLLIAIGFMSGLGLTFLAVNRGDVSVATPVFGIKVIFVPLILWLLFQTRLPASMWISAAMATAGIIIIQWRRPESPKAKNSPATTGEAPTGEATTDEATTGETTSSASPRFHPAMISILAAGSAALLYALIDVALQTWSPAWGTGRLLPITFWCVGVLTLPMAFLVPWRRLAQPRVAILLGLGTFFTLVQVICITFTLSRFGDATRVNVVYGLRGLWSVALAYAAAKIWGGGEAHLSAGQLIQRTTGAVLLTAAVVVAIL